MTGSRRFSAVVAALAAGAAWLGLNTVSSASADAAGTCTVAVVDDLTQQSIATYDDVPVPPATTDQPTLLRALEQAGDVPAGGIDLTGLTLVESCGSSSSSASSSSGDSSTSSSTSTTTTTTTTGPTSTAGPAQGSPSPPSPSPSPTEPSTPTPAPLTTSTSSNSTSTSTSRSGTTPSRNPSKRAGTTTAARQATTTSPRTTSSATATTTSTPRAGTAHNQLGSSVTTPRSAARRAANPASAPGNASSATGNSADGSPTFPNPFTFSLKNSPMEIVPDFFIDSFQIPPFLLPIYQAAGVEYDVPWQVLASINEIETDFGRNLSVSSAGAVGWMQFEPATWRRWGVDANGDGIADPYNPVDAIFSAARYLHAAGASHNLARSVLAYNHAGWYVQSVLLRAKLIAGISGGLVSALTGLVEDRFPVAARAHYAEDSVLSAAARRLHGPNAADPVESDARSRGTTIYAHRGAPAVAVVDGKVVGLGHSATLGNYVALQDATGNVYTYAQLGSISREYAAPKPVRVTAADIAAELRTVKVNRPAAAASAGSHSPSPTTAASPTAASTSATTTTSVALTEKGRRSTTARTGSTRARPVATRSTRATRPAPAPVKVRLFADPARRASYAAGGKLQLHGDANGISNFDDYFSDVLHLARNQYTLRRLRVGSIVVGGTILGRIGARSDGVAPHLRFMIQPAGRRAPRIDPKPILDGWKLLQATDVYRSDALDPFSGPKGRQTSVGEVLLMSKEQLMQRTLADPDARIYACGRRDIEAGLIDRRVLGVIEFLAASGLRPTISGLACDAGRDGIDGAGKTGESVDISAIDGIPIAGHSGPSSVTALTIGKLLTLQGEMAPDYIVSGLAVKGEPTTLALPDHKNRIQVSFTPDYGTNPRLSQAARSVLRPGQWTRLIDTIAAIPEPAVPVSPSKYAIHERQH